MVKLTKKEKKSQYFEKLTEFMAKYPKVLIVHGDNVSSKQFAEIRIALRGKAYMLFGKNTMIRTCLRQQLEEHPEYQTLIDLIKLNIGLVFCIAEPSEVRSIISKNKKPAAARQGAIAPIDLHIPAGITGLDPSQTNFFQTLGIGTKITKGQIEIVANVHLIKKDTKVTASQAALLKKLGIRPFEYGLDISHIYDNGDAYPASVLDITDATIQERFMKGVNNVAALSLALNYPTAASMPHLLLKAYKNCVALVAETDYTFKQMTKIREFFKNPSAFAAAAAPAAAAAKTASPKKAAAPAPKAEEKEEEVEFDLF